MKSDTNTNRYRTMHVEDGDSGTEIDDLLNERDYVQASSQPNRSRFLAIFKAHRWVVDTFLLFVIVGLLLERSLTRRGNDHYFEGNGDITGFAPQCEPS
jgi:hypothetical protein